MLITQNHSACNNVDDKKQQILITSTLESGIWYYYQLGHSFDKKCNTAAIEILSKLLPHLYNSDIGLQLNLNYFKSKFNVGRLHWQTKNAVSPKLYLVALINFIKKYVRFDYSNIIRQHIRFLTIRHIVHFNNSRQNYYGI